jgi:RNA polymerase sigma-70 factor (ECF subfamily)
MGSSTLAHRAGTDTDLDLLRRLHNSDRDAFGELYRRTADTVTRYITARMHERDRDAIDDLVQDAYCDALADATLIGPDLLGSMLRLAARACTRHAWSQRRYLRTAHTVYEDRTCGPDAAQPATTTTVLRRLGFTHALARLTPIQRRAIQLRYLDGYPRDQTPALMSRNVQAVRSLDRRALRRLHVICTA